MPLQQVQANTIKSIVAALFCAAALIAFFWPGAGQTNRRFRWSVWLLVSWGLAVVSVVSAVWTPANQALTEAVHWLIFGTITWITMNSMGAMKGAPFSALAKSLHLAAFTMALLALSQFWLDFPWFPSILPGATFGNRAALIAVSLCIVLSLVFALFFMRPAGSNKPPAINRWLALLVPLAVVAALGWIPAGNCYLIDENTALSRGLTLVERTAIRSQSLGSSATCWPGLRASSWLLRGQLAANRTPGQMSPEALAGFKAALSFSLTKDYAAVTAQIAGGYRRQLN